MKLATAFLVITMSCMAYADSVVENKIEIIKVQGEPNIQDGAGNEIYTIMQKTNAAGGWAQLYRPYPQLWLYQGVLVSASYFAFSPMQFTYSSSFTIDPNFSAITKKANEILIVGDAGQELLNDMVIAYSLGTHVDHVDGKYVSCSTVQNSKGPGTTGSCVIQLKK